MDLPVCGTAHTVRECIRAKKRSLKPYSKAVDFWTAKRDIYQLCQDLTAIKLYACGYCRPCAHGDKFMGTQDQARPSQIENLQSELWAFTQKEKIAETMMRKLKERQYPGQQTSIYALPFCTSILGMNLSSTSAQKRQVRLFKEMKKVYCPVKPDNMAGRVRWDPVLQNWLKRSVCTAAQLYHWRQADSMDAVYGRGARKDLFTPRNGLFLHHLIERALRQGHIAIVPDVHIVPQDPFFFFKNQSQQCRRIRDWEAMPIKEYKVVVINRYSIEANIVQFSRETHGITKLVHLHNRKLQFLTDARPSERYVWWTLLNATIWASCRQSKNNTSMHHQRVRYVAGLWGARGQYVRRNQLQGIVDMLGPHVESILEVASSTNGEEDNDYQGYNAVLNSLIRYARKSEHNPDCGEDEEEHRLEDSDWEESDGNEASLEDEDEDNRARFKRRRLCA